MQALFKDFATCREQINNEQWTLNINYVGAIHESPQHLAV